MFFTDLRVPRDCQIGDLNDGWLLATAMLMYERVAIGTGQTSGIKTPNFTWYGDEAKRRGRTSDPLVRQSLIQLYSDPPARRHSVQIEINRRLYMIEDRFEKNDHFAQLRYDLDHLVETIAGWTRSRL